MPIEIVSYRFKRQFHLHKCPLCRRVLREPNEICGKISGDHVYPCLNCLQDQRRRFSDDILDVWLGPEEIDRLHHVVPDQVSDYLDLRDAARREEQLKAVEKHKAENPEAFRPKTQDQRAKETHEKIDQLRETATVVLEDEWQAELKKIKEDEKI